MTNTDMIFVGVKQVVAHPLTFKHKLAIGEDAFTSMRLQKHLGKAWDVVGAAGTVGAAAKSSVVANAFFGKAGLMAVMGGASTPLGWVLAASVVGGGAWFALTKVLRAETDKRVDIIPKFINTPLDILAIRLFELMVPLALQMVVLGTPAGQVANAGLPSSSRHLMQNYLVGGWGYDHDFIDHALPILQANMVNTDVLQTARQLAYYEKQNPDCNYQAMRDDLLAMMRAVAESVGAINSQQQGLLADVDGVYSEVAKNNTLNKGLESLKGLVDTVASGATGASETVSQTVNELGKVAETAAGTAKDLGSDLGKRVLDLVNKR